MHGIRQYKRIPQDVFSGYMTFQTTLKRLYHFYVYFSVQTDDSLMNEPLDAIG